MAYIDGYAHLYQQLNGFEVTVETPKGNKKAYISPTPTTRAAYDLAMRENSIQGIITMDDIKDLKSGYVYTLKRDKDEIYFIQTLSMWEAQLKTRNFNAAKCNCLATVKRRGFKDDLSEEEWIEIYKDVPAYIDNTLSESKNFNAGFEVSTLMKLQLPIWEIYKDEETGKKVEKPRIVQANDTIFVQSLISEDVTEEIHVESVDNLSISGAVFIQGTPDMRI